MNRLILLLLLCAPFAGAFAQTTADPGRLTLERLFNSNEFRQESGFQVQWISGGAAILRSEPSPTVKGGMDIVRYTTATQEREVWISAEKLLVEGQPLRIEQLSLSADETKVLIFNNSSRVWRSNTKGDFWVYDLVSGKLSRLGKDFPPSSLMFAKFSANNQYVAYVHRFNIYREDFASGKITALTSDGSADLINGTFDWVYEEEFGKRDGFLWSPDGARIAFWQLDASEIGTFYMINNTDSIYPKLVPVQYPKVGQEPSACRVGLVGAYDGQIQWVEVPGGAKANYLPGMQWVDKDLLLIQQLNRKQNKLTVWAYRPSDGNLRSVYTETEDTWVDIQYPDISSNNWGKNDLPIVDKGKAFLRLTENDGWRHVYKVYLKDGSRKCLTPGDFDVASVNGVTDDLLYFTASPENSTQRYLFATDLSGRGRMRRLSPVEFAGINTYNISPDGQHAIHSHHSTTEPHTLSLVSLPDHRLLKVLVDNQEFRSRLASLDMPEIRFDKVITEDGLEIDVRMVMPLNFDSTRQYPVLFHVYGEPWGQVCIDGQVGLWNVMLAQMGYVVVDMDNRGTPCLKGSAWRKSIYRQIGRVNIRDQAQAARELLKRPYLDPKRTAVWGWSGGGSTTLHLLFQYPELYHTGVAVAAVATPLIYDNIYQERYMGLPQENNDDFLQGSPISYAENLEGNLLLIHGTADDNVHYQSAEMMIDELVAHNKAFDLMIYPNRSHGIYEGRNTRRHLYKTITEYLLEHTPVNPD